MIKLAKALQIISFAGFETHCFTLSGNIKVPQRKVYVIFIDIDHAFPCGSGITVHGYYAVRKIAADLLEQSHKHNITLKEVGDKYKILL